MQKFNGDLYGADIMLGYKHFFGAKKHLGLRYYAIFSGQGGSIWQNQSSTLGYTQPAANLFYGVGMDILFNLYCAVKPASLLSGLKRFLCYNVRHRVGASTLGVEAVRPA
ncbi:outer membrane beta-barrel protein [Helicobacter suis]|uniref:outer membrane beta-barrel protein n=1 Tax=Helicobacter suis TaxID=104628 RepID=UPI0013D5A021|nr:outer membrane beta-barrel protein [Helicobacter suis]